MNETVYIFQPEERLAQFEQEPARRLFRRVSAGDVVALSPDRVVEIRALFGEGCLSAVPDAEGFADEPLGEPVVPVESPTPPLGPDEG